MRFDGLIRGDMEGILDVVADGHGIMHLNRQLWPVLVLRIEGSSGDQICSGYIIFPGQEIMGGSWGDIAGAWVQTEYAKHGQYEYWKTPDKFQAEEDAFQDGFNNGLRLADNLGAALDME